MSGLLVSLRRMSRYTNISIWTHDRTSWQGLLSRCYLIDAAARGSESDLTYGGGVSKPEGAGGWTPPGAADSAGKIQIRY